MPIDILNKARSTLKPTMFQGWGRKKSYFEGWYYKIVTADKSHAYAIIPGISMGEDPHAFIQVMDGIKYDSKYFRFDINEFKPRDTHFSVKIGKNHFSANKLELELDGIRGTLKFHDLVEWPTTILRPGIMGWYSYVPFMQCYHGLVSLNHNVFGSLAVNGSSIDFTNGKGYGEKDWGSSFPKSWIWTQCNHYGRPLSVMASIAHIPWLNSHFIGFLAVLWNGANTKLYTTYTGAHARADIIEDEVHLRFEDKESVLEIVATQGPGAALFSPIEGTMVGKVNESIQAIHTLTYQDKNGQRIEENGECAGLEIAGEIDILTGQKHGRGA